MKITYVYADTALEWNCSEWRCAVPMRAINRAGHDQARLLSIQDFFSHTPLAQDLCRWADLIVVQRNLFGPTLNAIQHWRARDKIVIADFDDAYDLMEPSNASYDFWSKGLIRKADQEPTTMTPLPLTQFKWGLRLVAAATTPSRRLVEDWQAYTRMVYLPNYIDLEKYKDITPEPHEGIWLGWGGSLSHVQSFTGSGILAALKRVCRARPQVRVLVAGADKRIAEQLPVPPEHIVRLGWVPYAEWPRRGLAHFDIGLAPLHGAYDERRSWIKVLEYLVMKIPWVASAGPAYEELAPYGRLVENTPAAWEHALLDVIDHLPEHRTRAAQEPYQWGVAQSVERNVDKIRSIYAAIYSEAAGGVVPQEAGNAG
jgi:glycosyltransferase involved in cell wall biosynthesis